MKGTHLATIVASMGDSDGTSRGKGRCGDYGVEGNGK